MRTSSLAALSLAAALIGCGSPATRNVTGQISTNTYAVDHAVVVAQSSDHRVWIAPVAANGRFTLTVPSNLEYRITLANTTSKSGVYAAVARINWPTTSGAQRWAHIGAGDLLNLGAVYKRGTKPSGGTGISCDGCNGGGDGGAADSGGGCKEDDGAKTDTTGKEDDCDCGNKTQEQDKCDKDDDGDKHDQECDKDDHDKGDGEHGDGGDHGDDDDHGDHCGCSTDGGAGGAGGGGGGGAGGGGGGGGVPTPAK